MAVISVPGPISGKGYKFRIAGDEPTVDERQRIDSRISQKEQAFQQEYAKTFGAPVDTGESEGIANYLGEIPKGLARGAVGFGETAGLGLASLLPESWEQPTREFIRQKAYDFSPQADIGLEDSTVGTVSEGVGSIAPLIATSLIPGVGPALTGGLAVAAGAGEASERARAAGATEDERNKATRLGAAVGVLDLIPIFGSMKKFLGPKASNRVADYILGIAMEGGEEAAQEATTQVLQNMIQQGYDPDQDLGEGTLASAGVGGLAGALIAAILPGRTRTPQEPPPAATTPAATTPAETPPATPPAAIAPPVPGFVETAPSETLTNVPPVVTPKATAPTREDSIFDEMKAEVADEHGYDFGTLQAMHDKIAAADDKIGAQTQLAAELEISPEQATKLYNDVRGVLDYGKQKAAANAAPVAEPTVRGKGAKAPKAPKAPVVAGTPGTAPTPATTTPAPDVNRVMQVLQNARKQQAAGKNQLVSKTGAQSLVDAGLLSPEDLLVPAKATAKVTDLLALGPDEVKARLAPAPVAEVEDAAEIAKIETDLERIFKTRADKAATAPVVETAPAPKPVIEEGAPFTRPLTEEEFQTLSDNDKARYQADPNMPPTQSMRTPAPVTEAAPVPAPSEAPNLRAPLVPQVTPKLPEGASIVGAGQLIPAPIRGVQTTQEAPKPEDVGKTPEQLAAERVAAEKEVVDNAAAQEKLNARWKAWVAANPDLAELATDASNPQGADPTTSADKEAILALLDRSASSLEGKGNTAAKNAHRYFSKFQNPGDALETMAYDAVFSATNKYTTPDDMKGTAEAKFLQGTGKAQAALAIEWVQANLTTKTDTFVSEQTAVNQRLLKSELENAKRKTDRVRDERKYMLNRMSKEEADALEKQLEELRKADEAAFNARTEFQNREIAKDMAATVKQVQRETSTDPRAGRKPTLPTPPWAKLLGLDSRIGLGLPLHPLAKAALARGDLRTALNVIAATTPNPRLSRIAEKLALKVGTTKVQVVSGLTNYKGQPVRGAFDPKTNTVMLDAENGMDVHTALHEMVHATTVQTLANKSHPMTKRLEKLYDNVKDVLANTYGGTSLEEFVSEASANPEFQAMLEQLQERGTKITAWSRFKNAVGNFLRGIVGLPPVQPNALDAASSLIDAILDPAPDTSNLGPLYMAANNPAEANRVLSAALRNGREPTKANLQDAGARLVEAKDDGFRWIRKGVMQLAPLHLLAQQAQKYFPSASKLNDLVNTASAAFSRARDTLHEFTDGLHQYMRKATPAQRENWNIVAHDSTHYEVEPWLSETEAKKRYGKGDDVQGKLKQYDRLKALWGAMDPEGQRQLRTSINYFKKLRNDALNSAEMSLKALFPDDANTVDIIWKSFNARLLAKGTVEPYLPLFREGDYVLTFNAFNPDTGTTETYSPRFMTARERAAYRAEIEPAVTTAFVEKLVMSPEDAVKQMAMREAVGRRNVDYSNVPPQSFVGQIIALMVKQKADPDIIRATTELIIDTLPETAYAKSFKGRTGVFGAMAEMDRAIIERATSLSRQQVQATYRGAFSRIKNDLNKEYDENPEARNSLGQRDMLDQLQAIANFAANPTRSKGSRLATGLAFHMTLGFNPSSALLNFFQLPGIVLPYLSGKYGMKDALSAMRGARIALTGSGRTRVVDVVTDKLDAKGDPIVEQKRVSSAYSISNYDFDAADMDARTKRLKFLVEEGEKLGQFNRSQVYDILDLDGVEGVGSKISAASGFMMHHSERMVREVTLTAAYQLEVDRMAKASGQPLTEADYRAAAREAVRLTEDTNGGTAAGATPRIAHSGIGAAVFMYKRFAVTMYGLLIKTAHQAVKGQSKEARKIAQYQLAGIFGATGMLAGVAGMPLYGVLASVFNLFRDDDEEDFETLTRQYLGDGPYRGLINHLTGINVATRIGLSDLLFRDNLVEKDQSAIWTLIEQVGGPVVGTALNVERGLSLWNEGEYMRGVENMMPAALRAPLRAFRFATQGAETMDGKPIIEDISPVEVAAQALGFNPARYQNQLESNAKKKKFERTVLERRNKLLDNYFYAYFNGDTETMREVAEDIYDFGTDYPELAISGETLRNSERQRTRSRENAYHGVTFNEKLRARAEAFGEGT